MIFKCLSPALLFAVMVSAQQPTMPKLETMLMLPEPRVLRTDLSVTPVGAEKTVLSPAFEIPGIPGIEPYLPEAFKKFGLSPSTFAERSKKTADRLLATLKPDYIKGPDGKVRYAVYRGERPIMASLLIAPSLPALFHETFGEEIWVALPDRHSLFVFPAKPEVVEEFSADLALRFREDPHAASPEIFSLKVGQEPRVVASFVD